MPRATVIREIRIEKLAPGGQGVAFLDDDGTRRAVFVPLVVPGDVVRAEIDLGQKPARGQLLSIVTAGSARIEPACTVAARCGGCDFMHIDQAAQRDAHEAMLRESLPASLRSIPIHVHRAPQLVGYRSRARLHLRFGKKNEIGFLGARSHDIVEAPRCLVLAPALERVRGLLPSWLAGAKGKGEARLALGAFPTRAPVVDLTFAGELPASFFAALERAVKGGDLAGARVLEEGATRPATFGDPAPWMLAADGAPIRLAPGGFGQASDDGNAMLGARVAALADALIDSNAAPVVELFSGAGNFTVALAARTSKLVAVESDLAACEAARENLARSDRGLKAKITHADANQYALPRGLRLVVLDPPRAGARDACTAIVASRAQHVIYVSCDPPTLGRDLAVLTGPNGSGGAYEVRSLDLFELFPQTSHVETVVSLSRTSASK